MKKFYVLLFASAILQQTSWAQTSFQVTSYSPIPDDFKLLLLTNKQIVDNDTINEKIVDLVEPMLLDSVLLRKKQHHRLFLVGWLIHAFGGYNWRAVDMHKQKFVGTVEDHGRSGSFEYTEWDIKFHLNFHLKKYLFKDFAAYDLQRKYHRQDIRPSHHTIYSVPPFVRDSSSIDSHLYYLGCELTPPPAFIPQLNYLFFPTLPGAGGLKQHSNFGTAHPTMGFYGSYCLDCNHNCHPEMHPYEWTWWLNLQDEVSTDKTWLVGLFHEGSNRFPKWSKNPMTGEIKIPFALKLGNEKGDMLMIKIEHLVFNKFMDKDLQALNIPENALSPKEQHQEVFFENKGSLLVHCVINFGSAIKTEGLKYWFTYVNLDSKNNIFSGYLNIYTSVQDLYTTKIVFSNGE